MRLDRCPWNDHTALACRTGNALPGQRLFARQLLTAVDASEFDFTHTDRPAAQRRLRARLKISRLKKH